MKRAWYVLRSALLWAVSLLHFAIVVPALIALAIVFDPKRHDWLQRTFCRRIMFFAGAKIRVVRSPGFDPQKTSFFVSNHVNLFDPFALYCAIPQFVRGWELESHFEIPIYGWLMKRFGNVPVPDVRRPADLRRMWRLTRDAINSGTSLIVFPEGKRTRDGHVDEFQEGAFRVAQQLEIPIVPVSIVGSFRHHRTGHWMFWPSTVTIHLHDTVYTTGMCKEEVPELRARVRELVSGPVEESLVNGAKEKSRPAEEKVTS
jgi:1-acyl-sn-glycerol-3-phosphate acyltransferase